MAWQFKRGDTFRLAGPHGLVDDTGAGISAAGYEVAADVAFRNGVKVSLVAAWVDGPANTALELSAVDTTDWPVGEARLDVMFTAPSGDRVTTATMAFPVVERVTDIA